MYFKIWKKSSNKGIYKENKTIFYIVDVFSHKDQSSVGSMKMDPTGKIHITQIMLTSGRQITGLLSSTGPRLCIDT